MKRPRTKKPRPEPIAESALVNVEAIAKAGQVKNNIQELRKPKPEQEPIEPKPKPSQPHVKIY